MYPIQIALLSAEALVMATLVLGLFRSRTALGLSPLYIVLGGFQYLEASLGLRVEVAPGWLIYPASTVMFTATLLAVLLVYIKEDTTEARKLVFGLVLANFGLTLVALIVSAHVRIPGSTRAGRSQRRHAAGQRLGCHGRHHAVAARRHRHHPGLRARQPLRPAAVRPRLPGAAARRLVRQRVVYPAGAGPDPPAVPGAAAGRLRRQGLGGVLLHRRAVRLPSLLRTTDGRRSPAATSRTCSRRSPTVSATKRPGSGWCATR